MKLSEGLRKGLAIKEKIGRPYCAAVIVAAGTSSRMGGTNKILTVLENLPVICRTVDVFDKCAMIDEIIVVTQQELLEKVSRYLKAYDKMRMVVAGGETRTDSVMAGLAAVSDRAQLVAVHDGLPAVFRRHDDSDVRTPACDRRSDLPRRFQGKEVRRRGARRARQGHHQSLDRRCGR